LTDSPEPDDLLREFDLTESVSHLLRRAHVRAEHLFVEVMKTPGLTARQTALLVASYRNPGATIADLGHAIDLDRNTTAEMTSRLVERELLRREAAAHDKRAWAVFIAPAGVQVLREVLPRNEELMRRMLEPLPPEYRPLFVKSLRLFTGIDHLPTSAQGEGPGRTT